MAKQAKLTSEVRQEEDQLTLTPVQDSVRSRVLADFLAGFQWPGKNGRLTKAQKQAAREAAALALDRLAR